MECKPVTLGITGKWDRTRYELLDRRAQVLAMFDAEDTLSEFSTHNNAMQIMTTANAMITLDLDRISTYEIFDSRSNPSLVSKVGRTLDAVAVEPLLSLQYLVGWDGADDAGAAAASGAASVIPNLDPLRIFDCAVLVDGEIDGWRYQAEFGVISDTEADDRLSRRVGRRRDAGAGSITANEVLDDLAPVSTFVDCTWFPPEPLVELTELDEAVDEAVSRACGVVAALHARLRGE